MPEEAIQQYIQSLKMILDVNPHSAKIGDVTYVPVSAFNLACKTVAPRFSAFYLWNALASVQFAQSSPDKSKVLLFGEYHTPCFAYRSDYAPPDKTAPHQGSLIDLDATSKFFNTSDGHQALSTNVELTLNVPVCVSLLGFYRKIVPLTLMPGRPGDEVKLYKIRFL